MALIIFYCYIICTITSNNIATGWFCSLHLQLTNPPATEATPQRVSIFEGHLLFEHEWKPEEDIKWVPLVHAMSQRKLNFDILFSFRAVIHICHGIHEHMGRYKLLAEHLKDNGILVRAIDLGNVKNNRR